MEARSQEMPAYETGRGVADITSAEQRIINRALEILARRMSPGVRFPNAREAGQYFVVRSHALEREVFSCAWLDAQHRLICVEEVSHGTLTQASVYAREVVKSALARNAAAVIFHHNHPSGFAEPSRADEVMTKRLTDALGLVDVKVLDHIVTGGDEWVSFAEKGMI